MNAKILGNTTSSINPLQQQFGNIDIYLFDQLLKGRITKEMKVLDAGCGGGRNLVYMLQNGYEVYGTDRSLAAIQKVQELADTVNPNISKDNFKVCDVAKMPFENDSFDVIINSAVLHFAATEFHFKSMIQEMWRVLKSGGILFIRLATCIGIEDKIEHAYDRWYLLPDGTERFLVDEAFLMEVAEELDAEMLEPLRTTNVQNKRCMTTWCLGKK